MKDIGTDESNPDVPCSEAAYTWVSMLPSLECNTTAVTYDQDNIPDNLMFFKRYVEPIILGLILLVGALGSGFILHNLISHPDMRTGPNTCIKFGNW
jgi:hypothetical protein